MHFCSFASNLSVASRVIPHVIQRNMTYLMTSNCFLQYIAGYTVANFWRYPIRSRVTKASALEFWFNDWTFYDELWNELSKHPLVSIISLASTVPIDDWDIKQQHTQTKLQQLYFIVFASGPKVILVDRLMRGSWGAKWVSNPPPPWNIPSDYGLPRNICTDSNGSNCFLRVVCMAL